MILWEAVRSFKTFFPIISLLKVNLSIKKLKEFAEETLYGSEASVSWIAGSPSLSLSLSLPLSSSLPVCLSLPFTLSLSFLPSLSLSLSHSFSACLSLSPSLYLYIIYTYICFSLFLCSTLHIYTDTTNNTWIVIYN